MSWKAGSEEHSHSQRWLGSVTDTVTGYRKVLALEGWSQEERTRQQARSEPAMKSQESCLAQTNREAGQRVSLFPCWRRRGHHRQRQTVSLSPLRAVTARLLSLSFCGDTEPRQRALSSYRYCSGPSSNCSWLGGLWQLWPSEQLLFVAAVLVPAGLGSGPKMEFYS